MSRQKVFLAYQRIRLTSSFHILGAVDVIPGASSLHRFVFPRLRPHEVTVRLGGLSITVDTSTPVSECISSERASGIPSKHRPSRNRIVRCRSP